MVADELRALTDDDLRARVADLREQLFKLRFQKTTGLAENAARLSHVRRDVARALTIIREREMGLKVGSAAAETGE